MPTTKSTSTPRPIWAYTNVTLIAETKILEPEFLEWIGDCSGMGTDTIMHERPLPFTGSELVEAAGRRCYNSFALGANANLTRIRESQSEYLQNIIKSRHGSVLEHVNLTFAIEGVSRVFTHELVRHRPGCAYSQESLRYVKASTFRMTRTPLVERMAGMLTQGRPTGAQRGAKLAISRITGLVSEIADRVQGIEGALSAALELGSETDFKTKKLLTSFLRRFLPQGMATGIVFTANLRALRHLIPLRTAPGAEEEIRQVFLVIGRMCVHRFPDLFFDFLEVEQDDGELSWVCEYEKV